APGRRPHRADRGTGALPRRAARAEAPRPSAVPEAHGDRVAGEAPRHGRSATTNDRSGSPEGAGHPARRAGRSPHPTARAPPAPPPPAPAPRPAPPPAPVSLAPHLASLDVRGALPNATVRAALDRVLPATRSCKSDRAGAVEVRFAIGESRRASGMRATGLA